MTGKVREDFERIIEGVPSWLVFVLALVFVLSAGLGVFMNRFDAWLPLWLGLAQVGVSLFVVYLFYRFVLAVERIAERL